MRTAYAAALEIGDEVVVKVDGDGLTPSSTREARCAWEPAAARPAPLSDEAGGAFAVAISPYSGQ